MCRAAQEMYERIFDMKFLPPGRGLWAMGSPVTEERYMYAALNNCAFVSTQNLKEEGSKPFTFLMDGAMLGVGVGFDTLGAGTCTKLPFLSTLYTVTTACARTSGAGPAHGTLACQGDRAACASPSRTCTHFLLIKIGIGFPIALYGRQH